MVDNSSKCIFMLIPMLGRVKNISYSSCLLYNYYLSLYKSNYLDGYLARLAHMTIPDSQYLKGSSV